MLFGRSSNRRGLAAGALGVVLTLIPVAPLSAASDAPDTGVIVMAEPGRLADAERALARVGGEIETRLDLIEGFSADVPAGTLDLLASSPGVAAVTPDESVTLLSDPVSNADYDPRAGLGSLLNVTTTTGAREYWAAGYTGQGVDVAVIDSGVVPVDGLRAPGKVRNGPDFSLDSIFPDLAHLDSFGHGTHMAGIIAGRDDAAVPGTYASDTEHFLGMAPDARIINVKIGATEGEVDISQVIAAIDWVIQNRTRNGMNIRVLNLSFGTDSKSDYISSPLAFAAELAWRKGIVVVASAGNSGYATGALAPGLTNPAIDPFVIAVGASDHNGTIGRNDDLVARFSTSGIGYAYTRNPDLVAPGRSIESLSSGGSLIDNLFPEAGVGDRFLRGSGSSQAAAVTSGAVALILSQHPGATPDQVKALLRSSAYRLPSADTVQQGAGQIDLARALRTPLPSAWSSRQRHTPGSGGGSLNWSRGSAYLTLFGKTLSGERDIFFNSFYPVSWVWPAMGGTSWQGNKWLGRTWIQDDGNGGILPPSSVLNSTWGTAATGDWTATGWSGSRWSGSRWSGSRWSGDGWLGSRWSGSRWSGSRWSDSRLLGSVWLASTWE